MSKPPPQLTGIIPPLVNDKSLATALATHHRNSNPQYVSPTSLIFLLLAVGGGGIFTLSSSNLPANNPVLARFGCGSPPLTRFIEPPGPPKPVVRLPGAEGSADDESSNSVATRRSSLTLALMRCVRGVPWMVA